MLRLSLRVFLWQCVIKQRKEQLLVHSIQSRDPKLILSNFDRVFFSYTVRLYGRSKHIQHLLVAYARWPLQRGVRKFICHWHAIFLSFNRISWHITVCLLSDNFFYFCSVNSCYHTISTMMKPLSQKSNWAVNSLTSDWILQDNLFIPLIADQYYWSMLFEIQIVCQWPIWSLF